MHRDWGNLQLSTGATAYTLYAGCPRITTSTVRAFEKYDAILKDTKSKETYFVFGREAVGRIFDSPDTFLI
jgi:hypothetical protein